MDATPAEAPPLPPPPASSRSSPVKTSPPAAAEATPSTSTDAAPGPGAAPATGNHSSSSSNSNSPVTATTMSTATAPAPEAPPQPSAPGHAFTMGNAPHQMMPGAPSDASAAQPTAPPTVNAAAASSAALMTSSAMTPTTTNYGMSAQLVKSTGTLTPMGEDKVSTAGPSGTQKAKQTKKKAAAADGETAKKPSPRVRTKADPNKAEKRKASPARSNGNNTSLAAAQSNGNNASLAAAQSNGNNASLAAAQSNGATPAPAPPATTPTAVPAQSYPPMGENALTAQQHELPPSQDTELRKQYLQRIYRQLQMTHRNQDDTMVRRLATNIEIDICRRVATRADYMNLMNQQIHSLMQAELANGTVGLQSSLYVPGVGMPPSSGAMNVPASSASGMPHPGLQQANVGGYKQGSTPVSGAADIGQRASTPTQGSFMSLLSGQSPMQSYEAGRAPQQYGAQGVPAQGRQLQYGAANGAPGYPVQGQGLPQVPTMKSDPQSELSSQQTLAGQRAAQPSPTSAPPDFVAQFQRLDRNGLVDLLWTQHKTVIQYQRRLAQLEVQLNARQNPATVGAANSMAPSSAGPPSGYYNASSGQPPGAVPANLSAEAEAQRARERATSRAAHQPGQYGQPQYPPQQAPTTPQGGVNPPLYWEKVRYLSEAYLRPLYVAHQALSQHSAPANSAQGAKAENVKHNIALACSILSEAPSTVQPRPLEVLDSIERFIQSTVVPIVRKVSPHNLGPPTPGSAQQVRPQQSPVDLNDPSRNAMGAPPVTQPAPTPTTASGMSYSNGPQPPVAVAPAASAAPGKASGKTGASKAGTKAAGKKSPSSGPKKAATPKATAAKSTTKAAGKKSPGKAGGAKQTAAAAKAAVQSNIAASGPLEVTPSGQVDASPASAAPVVENTQKVRSEMPPIKTGGMTDDDLNDFSDFADLDFDDDLQDPLVKVSSNKENATGVNARKRSIEDV